MFMIVGISLVIYRRSRVDRGGKEQDLETELYKLYTERTKRLDEEVYSPGY